MVNMEPIYRKENSTYLRGFKNKIKKSPEFSHDILGKLAEIGIEGDILIKSAMDVGGISNSTILRIYSKMGDEEVTKKMQKLVEDALFEKTVNVLKHYYI